MLRIILVAACAFTIVINSMAQIVVGGVQAKGIDMNTTTYGTVTTFGFPEKTISGSTYLYKDWQYGFLEIESKIIKDIPLNIDVQNNLVELNTEKGALVVPFSRVTSLTVLNLAQPGLNTLFKSAKTYNLGHHADLFEVLVNDSLNSLLKSYYTHINEGAYNPTLDMGNNGVKYSIKHKYYLHRNGKIEQIQLEKKRFLKQFDQRDRTDIEGFISKNKISLKNENHLKSLTEFMNFKKITLIPLQ